MKNKRNLNIKWLLLQNDQNADTTLLHSHDEICFHTSEFSDDLLIFELIRFHRNNFLFSFRLDDTDTGDSFYMIMIDL